MKYELLFQAAVPGAPYDPSRIDALLADRSTVRGDGTRLWRVQFGQIELRPLVEGGRPVATEVKIPLQPSLELIREVLIQGAELATRAECVLFDPQLMRPVGPKDEGAVTDGYVRTARYAGEMAGVSEAIGIGQPPVQEGMKPGTKVFLGVIGFLILLYLVTDRLL